jgi:hypothetical protein
VDSAGRVREGKQARRPAAVRIGGGWGIVDGMVEDIWEEEDNVEEIRPEEGWEMWVSHVRNMELVQWC